MNWTSLIGPAVIAAVISGLVAGIGMWISARTARCIHTAKLAFDREESERGFVREVGLTEAKINADLALAEKRLALDRALAAWKRRTEFAEEVLADFYQAREIIRGARSPASFDGEGKTRTKADWETEDDIRALNAYFATMERLMSKGEFFAQLHARRYRFLALFGQEAGKPYEELFKLRGEVMIAVRMLVTTYRQHDRGSLPQSRQGWEDKIWDQGDGDPISGRVDRVIEAVEQICRPVIQETGRQ